MKSLPVKLIGSASRVLLLFAGVSLVVPNAPVAASDNRIQDWANILYQRFEVSATKPLLQTGDVFPKLTFQTMTGKQLETRGQRLLILVGGPCILTCPELFKTYGQQLAELEIKVVNVIVSDDLAPFDNIPRQVVLVDMRDPTSMTAGRLGPMIGLPNSPAYYLLDANGRIRFESTSSGYYFLGANYIGKALLDLKQGVKEPQGFRRPRPNRSFPSPLPPGFADVLKYTASKKSSVLLLSTDACTVCQGFFKDFRVAAQRLLRLGYGVVYLSIGIKGQNRIDQDGLYLFHDTQSLVSTTWGFGRYPNAIIVKADRYIGEVSYMRTGQSENKTTDESFQLALSRALKFAETK